MSASRIRRLFRHDKAEVGVGTLIIFIAMVLVAAVAAAVIIGTSGSLQQRAQATGKEATQEVSSNVKVVSIYGVRATSTSNIGTVQLFLALAAGSQDVDLSQLILRYSDGTNVKIYKLADATNPFTLTWVRGDAGSDNVMESGDLVQLQFTASPTLAPRSEFDLQLIPIVGAPQDLDITTPPTYGTDLYHLLE